MQLIATYSTKTPHAIENYWNALDIGREYALGNGLFGDVNGVNESGGEKMKC